MEPSSVRRHHVFKGTQSGTWNDSILPASLHSDTQLINTYVSSSVTKVFEEPMRLHDDSGARRDTACSWGAELHPNSAQFVGT